MFAETILFKMSFLNLVFLHIIQLVLVIWKLTEKFQFKNKSIKLKENYAIICLLTAIIIPSFCNNDYNKENRMIFVGKLIFFKA